VRRATATPIPKPVIEQNCTDQQTNVWIRFPMAELIRILTVEHDGDDGLIVTFSDGTTGAYVVEELLDLRPRREPTKVQGGSGNDKQD